MYLSNYSLKALIKIRHIASNELTLNTKARKAADSVGLRRRECDLVTDLAALNVAIIAAEKHSK